MWRTHLPKDYLNSLGAFVPDYTDMQKNLTPSATDRVKYAREAFHVTTIAEEWKLIEEDPHGALNLLVYYLHHSRVIMGDLKDKYEKKTIRLEAPSLVVPQSSAAIIEKDIFRDQMLTRNHIANLRLEEIKGYKREVINMKGTLQQQHAALVKSDADLT